MRSFQAKLRPIPIILGLALALGLFSSQASGDYDESWMLLERGREAYEAGRHGDALSFFRKAIEMRHARMDERIATMEKAIDPDTIRKIKDSLGDFKYILGRRGNPAAVAIIDETLALPGADGIVTVGSLMDKLRALRAYPEAEFWLGKVYAEESELELARLQFEKAYAERASLVLPDFKYRILYELAQVSWTLGLYKDAERAWKTAVADDAVYAAPDKVFYREGMLRILRKDGIDKFLLIYRSDALYALEGHLRLSYYFYRLGDYDAAVLHGAIGAAVFFTSVYDRFKAADPDFEMKGLADILARIGAVRELSLFATTSGIYGGLFYLANALYVAGSRASAIGLWEALAAFPGAAEWRERSKAQLAKPAIDRASPFP